MSTVVACASSGKVIVSTDSGASWGAPITLCAYSLRGVAYSGSRWVVVGASGSAYYSDSAVTWYAGSGVSALDALYGVCYGGGQFVAVGDAGAVYSSPDGASWTLRATLGTNLKGVAYGAGVYVAVGDAGAVYSSPDGASWTSRTSGTSYNLTAVTWSQDVLKFVAVASSSGAFTSSPDGALWAAGSYGTYGWYSVCSGAAYVVMLDNGNGGASTDLSSWTSVYTGSVYGYCAVYCGSNVWMYGGNGRTTKRSTVTPPSFITTVANGLGTSDYVYGMASDYGASVSATATPAGFSAASAVGTPAATGGAATLPPGLACASGLGTAAAAGAASALAQGLQAAASLGAVLVLAAALCLPSGVQAGSVVGTCSPSAAALVATAGVQSGIQVGSASASASVGGLGTPSGQQATSAVGQVSTQGSALGGPPGVAVATATGIPAASAGGKAPAVGVSALAYAGVPLGSGGASVSASGLGVLSYVGTYVAGSPYVRALRLTSAMACITLAETMTEVCTSAISIEISGSMGCDPIGASCDIATFLARLD